MLKHLMLTTLLGSFVCVAGAQSQPASVMGVWLVEKKTAQVKIERCANPANGPICGSIVRLINPKGPDGTVVSEDIANDWHNADPRLRDRKVVGLVIIYNFKPTSDPNSFENGYIYNGDNGKTYNANISLQPDGTLRLRGYVGTPMFGETQIWTRVQ
jgi:uncharacterized protein (DUF2147 family)